MKSVIIDRLIQIEDSALSITKDVLEKESNLPVLIQQKCAGIENKLKIEFEKKSEEVRATKEKEALQKIEDMKKEAVVRYKKLDEFYAQNHKTWETDIFNTIVGR